MIIEKSNETSLVLPPPVQISLPEVTVHPLSLPVLTTPTPPPVRSFVRTGTTWLAYLLIGLYSYLLNVFGPLMPVLKAELGLTAAQVSLHFSAFALGIIAAGLAGAALVRRLGRSRMVLLGAGGMAFTNILLVVGQSAVMTIGSAFLIGLLGTFLFLTMPPLFTEQFGERRIVALAEANVGGSLFAVLAPLCIGLSIGVGLTWRGALVPISLGLVIFAVWFVKSLPQVSRSRTGPARSAEAVVRPARLPGRFWLGWGMITMAVSMEFCLISWGGLFLEQAGSLKTADAASTMSLFLGAMLVGRIAGSRLLTLVPARKLLIIELVLTGLGFLIFWLSTLFVLTLLGLAMCGLGIANLYPLSLDIAMKEAGGQIERASARASLASGLAIFSGPLVLGALADAFQVRLAYGIVLLLWLAMVGLLGLLGWLNKRVKAARPSFI